MRRATVLLSGAAAVAMLVSSTPATPAAGAQVVRTPGDPAYDVHLRSNRTGHVWSGTETITFANLDDAPLTDLWIRLWSNGVAGCASQAIQATLTAGGVQEGELTQDCTAMHVHLDAPVAPAAEGSLAMDVRIAVPALNDRFGYHDGLTYLGTALPTLAVHDDEQWHTDPFVDLGESFYSVVGSYDVTLDVPLALDTPTTGVAATSSVSGRRRTTTFHAEDVRDFEWVAGRLSRVSRTTVDGTKLRAWFEPSQTSRGQADRALADAVSAMERFADAFGDFPYPEMDIVLSRFTSFGGMEYPTIVFANPDRATVSHELAHQYWYGLVGNDQFSEPWLDESFATWSQSLPWEPRVGCRIFDWPTPGARLTNDMAYWDAHRSQYWVVYDQGACMLANLARRFGLPRFLEVLRGYADAHRMGVVRAVDFQAAIEAAAATDLPGFDAVGFWDRWRVGPA